MQSELVVRRRRIGSEDLETIRQLIREEGPRGRSHLSARLCRIWNWRQANGRFREIACRDLLRRLQGRGLIELPPPLRSARRPGYRNVVRAPAPLPPIAVEGPWAAWRQGVEVHPVRDPGSTRAFNGWISTYHYLGYQQPTGAQLKYLVCHQGRPLACLSFGPAALKVGPRDRFIGWTAQQREQRLGWLVNNDRFLMLPWAQIPHLASWILSRCLRRLREDWREVYRHDLALCETFVEEGRFRGCSYAASNWIEVGRTQGRGRNDRFHRLQTPPKTLWLYPLRRDFRQRLCSP